MASAKDLYTKIQGASASSASSHPLAGLNLTGEFLSKDINCNSVSVVSGCSINTVRKYKEMIDSQK